MSEALANAPRIMVRGINGFLCRTFKAIAELHNGDRRVAIALLVLALKPNGHAVHDGAGSERALKISVYALAKSLAVPYETMRRSVAVLINAGLCERAGRDALTLCRTQKAAAAVAGLRGIMADEFHRLLGELKAADFDFSCYGKLAPLRVTKAPVAESRVLGWPSCDLANAACLLFLRFVEVGSPLHQHDLSCTMVFAAVVSSNLAHFANDQATAWRFATLDSPPPDELRKAVSIRAISDMLGMPVETTRRSVCRLIESGECIRVAGRGVIAPASVLEREHILKLTTLMVTRLDQALSELGRRGFAFDTVISTSNPVALAPA